MSRMKRALADEIEDIREELGDDCTVDRLLVELAAARQERVTIGAAMVSNGPREPKTRYKYIHFVELAKKPKTTVWACYSNRSNDQLGAVQWYGPWRQYCFFPMPGADLVFNGGCLEDIRHFMEQLR